MTQMQFEKLKKRGKRRLHRCFYTSSPATWATSSPLLPLTRISTNLNKVYKQITLESFLNPTRRASTPLCSSHRTRWTPTVLMQYTLQIWMQTHQYNNSILQFSL